MTPALELRMGYWCEAIAYTAMDSRTYWLGSCPAATPRLALRWLRSRAGHITDQLDPATAGPARSWLIDDIEHQYALGVLTEGGMYTHTIPDGQVRYLLSARPAARTVLPRQDP
ncbi:hypothetical protein E1265_16785 [Streptomyces sp. 8K308]|uniref:hypothetical protein n=1 Tax=Streptomyces sp. 8K308 TaxID=2530388 RepID=UPI001053447F|nr:hypothetical protein [Streptomyces sp. 8K308]TDC21954.1 hypothetical protein E1265_16785 [Streptomyces sp. 8K308]